jgi:hypothetical protein
MASWTLRLLLTLGAGGALCSLFFPALVDAWALEGAATLRNFLRRHFSPATPPDFDYELASRLTASLRAGISLDSALEQMASESTLTGPARSRLRRILDRKPEADFLSHFLSAALNSGMPALAALTTFQKALQTRRRLALKARAATGQSRAQAEVLSWLPWVMALGLMLVDRDWFALASGSPLAWFFWAIAIGLTGLGRWWIRHALRRALSPRTEAERLEEAVLPDFGLRLLSELSLGSDVEGAVEKSLLNQGDANLRDCFAPERGIPGLPGRVAALRSTLKHASATGAPVREDLLSFLLDLQFELESRWEERVQRLPVAMLAPLFLCFFPGSLLVLLGLLLPLLREAL